ncbi:MAG: BrnT family toxin [Cyanobacteria bacterium J06632_22]
MGDASKEDETRFFVLGISLKTRLLLVIHIERGERTRIISARNATKAEQRLYQDEQF